MKQMKIAAWILSGVGVFLLGMIIQAALASGEIRQKVNTNCGDIKTLEQVKLDKAVFESFKADNKESFNAFKSDIKDDFNEIKKSLIRIEGKIK